MNFIVELIFEDAKKNRHTYEFTYARYFTQYLILSELKQSNKSLAWRLFSTLNIVLQSIQVIHIVIDHNLEYVFIQSQCVLLKRICVSLGIITIVS